MQHLNHIISKAILLIK